MHLKAEPPYWPLKAPILGIASNNMDLRGRMKNRDFSVFQGDSLISQKRMYEFSKPPPFVTGGFVGSKSVEHQDKRMEFSILAALVQFSDMIIVGNDYSGYLTVPSHGAFSNSGKMSTSKAPSQKAPSSYAEVAKCVPLCVSDCIGNNSEPAKVKESAPEGLAETSRSVIAEQAREELSCSPKTLRTVSESSDQSWATVEEDSTQNKSVCNPWLRSIIGTDLEDSEDEDEDDDFTQDEEEEEDADLSLIDITSENGEVVDTSKWKGELLSPICSPLPLPESSQLCEDYDSDEEDGFLIYCGPPYDEEDEKKLCEERIRDANLRWQQSLRQDQDQVDFGRKKKQVHFPADDKLKKVRPMITWSHAYRSARQGHWEILARDSERFRARIASAARVLEPILTTSHRDLVWKRMHSDL